MMTTPEKKSPSETRTSAESTAPKKHVFVCDRCGSEMQARQCKLICANCGARFDCSDLNLYFD